MSKLIAPFAQCKEQFFPKEKGICTISHKPLKKNEPVFAFRFADFNDIPIEYAKKEVFLHTEEYATSYLEKFLPHKYDINDFLEKSPYYIFYNPVIREAVTDLKKVIQVISDPPLKPRPHYYSSELNGKPKPHFSNIENREGTSHDELFKLLAIYINCGYADYFLKHLEEFPIPSWFLFAMSNDLRFQKKISNILDIDIVAIFSILEKRRLTLDNILKIIDIVNNNKKFLENFKNFITLYQTHLTGVMPPHGFTRFANIRNGQLCYLFIAHPNYHPLLERCIYTGEFPLDGKGTFTYIKCFYQRARVIHHLIKREWDIAIKIAAHLEEYINYYPSGNPKGFINDTQKMVAQFIKEKDK